MATGANHPDIIAAHHVAQAIEDQLRKWLDTYLGVLSAEATGDTETLPPIAQWGHLPDLDLPNRGRSPALMVVANGFNDFDGDPFGGISATCTLAVIIACEANSDTAALAQSSRYCAAIRTTLINHPDLPNLNPRWVQVTGEAINRARSEETFWQGLGIVEVEVNVPTITGTHAADTPHGRAPWPDPQQIATVEIHARSIPR